MRIFFKETFTHKQKPNFSKIFCYLLVISVLCIFYSQVTYNEETHFKIFNNIQYPTFNLKKYLINTSHCKIPDVDPFNEEVRRFIYRESYTNCNSYGLLTYIEKRDNVALLKINTSNENLYVKSIKCCYSNIERITLRDSPETTVRFSSCIPFEDEVQIIFPYIQVTCRNSKDKQIYANIHAIALMQNDTVVNYEEIPRVPEKNNNYYSVMLIGIDAVSRLNFMRTMPNSYKYVEENYVTLKGYNKIADNTFPNLGGVLSGQTKSQLNETCKFHTEKLDGCDFIWKHFKDSNYVTGYAEDEINISTFNLETLGFLKAPTDFYLRSYMIAAHELPIKYVYGMSYCTGPETSGERILNAAKDFSITYKEVPKFGLFWMNSFSHDNINRASVMDEKLLAILNDTKFTESLKDTFVILFSDHGFRFGDIRWTYTGWLEERLPFIYVYVPPSFKINFQREYNNFLLNTKRLTTPYDLYMTLQNIIHIANNTYEVKPSQACPNCHSLFQVVKENRTCREASIDQHWCTCNGHSNINPKEEIVIDMAQYVIRYINSLIKSAKDGYLCSRYSLNLVYSAGMSEDYLNESNQTLRNFLLLIETSPSAMFEATVELKIGATENAYSISGDISRLNKYEPFSHCTHDTTIKKYCYCNTVISRLLCSWRC